jgi:hypothetical protein
MKRCDASTCQALEGVAAATFDRFGSRRTYAVSIFSGAIQQADFLAFLRSGQVVQPVQAGAR